MPARACGTIRTVFASTAAAKSTISTNTTSTNIGTPSVSVVAVSLSCPTSGQAPGCRWACRPVHPSAELGHRVHEGGRALDLEDVDPGPDGNHLVLVVRAGRPDLAAHLDLPALRGDLLDDQCLPADQRVVAEHQLGTAVQ